MNNTIQQTVLDAWQKSSRTRSSSSGWISGNAVCCHHRGHRDDRRGRGGLIVSGDGSVSYSCFNCGFKTHYRPGWALSFRMRQLMTWMSVPENTIRLLILEAIRVKDQTGTVDAVAEQKIEFAARPLPEHSQSFGALADFYCLNDMRDCPSEFLSAVSYVADRKIDMNRYDFYWSTTRAGSMNRRVIVPFQYEQNIVGYSARTFDDRVRPRYLMDTQPGYVFNINNQTRDRKFVVVCEGIFDALSIDAVAVMHNEISEPQADQVDNLGKEIIVVPDWDTSGQKLVEQAINFNWSVSFPIWRETCKDINQAIIKYGKLFVLKDILAHVEHSSLKIQLWSKKTRWYNA